MAISDDEFTYVVDLIAGAVPKDLQKLVDLNNRLYLKVGELSKEYRKRFKPGDPVVVSISDYGKCYGRIVKSNPKTFKVAITDSDNNPTELRNRTVNVSHFQVTVAEKV